MRVLQLLILASIGYASLSEYPWLSQPFVAGIEGYASYRIPALLLMPNGDLLAFCEGRKFSSADADWNDIVMKRSSDSGRTWSALQVIHSESTAKHHVTIGNPSPTIVTSKPGRVVLLGARQLSQGFRVISEDYGKTWGPAVYLPNLDARREHDHTKPKNGQNASNWTFYMPGPASGVQLPSGRLVVCAYHGVEFNKTKQGSEAFSFTVFSDDLGENWSWHDGHAYDVGPSDGECQFATAPNGSLIMRTRTAKHDPPAFSWSNDDGTSWSAALNWTNEMMHAKIYDYHYDWHVGHSVWSPFYGSNTQGSIARLPGSGLLVTSVPFAMSRANMTVWVSADSGMSWHISNHVYSGYSGYSAIQGLNATHAGLLWEICGHYNSSAGDPFHLAFIVLEVKNPDDEAFAVGPLLAHAGVPVPWMNAWALWDSLSVALSNSSMARIMRLAVIALIGATVFMLRVLHL